VAVAAEDTEVIEPVVGVVPVDVVEFEGDRAAHPVLEPTRLATRLLDPRGDEAAAERR
jgi:hypothetical protein